MLQSCQMAQSRRGQGRPIRNLSGSRTFLIWNVLRDLQKVHVAERNPDVFGLTSSEAACEVRIPKDACRPASVHGLGCSVGICFLTLR